MAAGLVSPGASRAQAGMVAARALPGVGLGSRACMCKPWGARAMQPSAARLKGAAPSSGSRRERVVRPALGVAIGCRQDQCMDACSLHVIWFIDFAVSEGHMNNFSIGMNFSGFECLSALRDHVCHFHSVMLLLAVRSPCSAKLKIGLFPCKSMAKLLTPTRTSCRTCKQGLALLQQGQACHGGVLQHRQYLLVLVQRVAWLQPGPSSRAAFMA